MARIELRALPPAESVGYFHSEDFAWQDVWKGEHAKACTVAKAMQLDLLADIRDGWRL